MFLGKGILKICSKFGGEHPCRSVSVPKNISGGLLLDIIFAVGNYSYKLSTENNEIHISLPASQ